MGLFDWFKPEPSNARLLDDVIWLTKKAKANGVLKAIQERVAEQNGPVAILLVAHFQDCLLELRGLEESTENSRIVAVLASQLDAIDVSFRSLRETNRIDFIVGERHPLRSHDELVVKFAGKLPCRCEIVHHLSLEDALMRTFAGEWVQTILKRLGMSENEAIASHMVASRLKKAQHKIEKQAIGDAAARSAEEWFEKNCPS